MNIPRCKKFSGYKPCISYENCLENGCQMDSHDNRMGTKFLIISLGGLSNVLLNTSILRSIKNKFPESTIYWLTTEKQKPLLENNQYIDGIYFWNEMERMILRSMKFDYLLNAEKSINVCAFANEINANTKKGFLFNSDGQVIPADEDALYEYKLGIDDNLKFKENKKSKVQIIHKTFGLEYKNEEYVYNFTEQELKLIDDFKRQVHFDRTKFYIGFNTGSSLKFPDKKMTLGQHIYLINELLKNDYMRVVLLGGKEDTERNLEIYDAFDSETQKKIIYTPTNLGLRSGASFMNIPDVVITGDSFGMHIAIALKKYVIAWFGITPPMEVELYKRGAKIIPEATQTPAYASNGHNFNPELISESDLNKIINLVKRFCLIQPFKNMIDN
jgi:ADP-heptose:LPS heptosyltransferase